MQFIVPVIAIVLGTCVLAMLSWRFLSVRTSVIDRLFGDQTQGSLTGMAENDPTQQGWIASWLFRAGFRGKRAEVLFWVSTLACGLFSGTVFFLLWQQGYFLAASQFISGIPGGVGNVFVPFILATPWLISIVFTSLPILFVRSVRRKRVQMIEKDLPLLLDLLDTLSQAGIGFDSAMNRILDVQNQQRPLVKELRAFQFDNLGGRSRIESLRRLIRRVEVAMFSTFIAAMIQAEQTGAAMSATLKTQSAEMRSRRREKAAAAAMSVPTLMVVPMVIGFLPGIFVVLLGPMLYEALGVLGQGMRGAMGN